MPPQNLPSACQPMPFQRKLFARGCSLSLALLCAMCGIFVISAMMSNYLVGYLKLPNTEMGFVSSAIGFGGVLGQLGVLTVSDYIGRRPATLISFVVAAIALWLLYAAILQARHLKWLSPKRVAALCIVGFSAALVLLWGITFTAELHHVQ